MIPEIGHFSLILALCLAALQGVFPLIGAERGNTAWMALGARAAYGQFLFLTISFACLTYSFIVKDFSVLYVAQNANSVLPLGYRISAVWGAHEGSLLLWALILGAWAAAVAFFSRRLSVAFSARVIAVLGLIGVGFLLFLLGTSNPFERLLPAALEGRDLNPLLQDPGLVLHPPTLYMGYVGMAVPFAFAVAAMLEGRLDAAWIRWSRPWNTVAWVFLTLGIALGSWWAYYELGWGGWWFWDPVENASLMPWLISTALLHSLAVSEKRNTFKSWTVLLAILGFSLSLLGTFLVRSGVLVSVHAFATDPTRGVFILAFLGAVVGSALTLFAWRGRAITSGGRFSLLSREAFLLGNNLLLTAACATVLLGTLYPLLVDIMGIGKISVGPPYFDLVFVPLMLPLAFLLATGPLVRWRGDSLKATLKKLWPGLTVSTVLGATFVWWIDATGALPSSVTGAVLTALAVLIAIWIFFTAVQGLWGRNKKSDSLVLDLITRFKGPRSVVGMTIAHIGVGVFIIGVTIASGGSVEQDVRMAPGEEKTLAGHEFVFHGITDVRGANYLAQRGDIRVYRDGMEIARLLPEKRRYLGKGQPMTEAAIDPGLTRDIYVALGEPLGDGAWAVRLYYKPFVRWIWLGPLLMALGGIWAASDRRRFWA